jgi:hypothetical protein
MAKLQQAINEENWELAAHLLCYGYFRALNLNPNKLRRLQNARKTGRSIR